MSTRLNLYDLDLDQLMLFMGDLGQPDYRARQLWHWLYQRYAHDYGQMTTLPTSLRYELAEIASLGTWKIAARQNSSDAMTTKLLFQLSDGNFIETVLMRYDKRRTICISTQAGCAMGCV
ncbi:MAG TPA: 23S rRNA (adenine(2503)-C2)-methyltransferase, partial [Anaerolineae bacterium]|nr:23S rRNA (adenine(2503)-C2)-methyltransferase [Anaerolineae bacterium]